MANINCCEIARCTFWDDECAYLENKCFLWDKSAEMELLNELKEIAKRKHEIWEEDTIGIGLTWRETPLALKYQELERRVWEIKEELFGDCAIEI